MQGTDYLCKELVDTFVYSTAKDDDSYCERKVVFIDGRQYLKFGRLQTLTFVGNVYNVRDSDTNSDERVLLIGLAKQSTEDYENNLDVAYEVAFEHSQTNPIAMIKLPSKMTKNYFNDFCRNYVQYAKRNFVMTKEEVIFKNCTRDFEKNICCNCNDKSE